MRPDLLTPREKECLRLLLYPMSAKEIARATGTSQHTVRSHLKEARRKLNTSSSIEAARLFREHDSSPQLGEVISEGWQQVPVVDQEETADLVLETDVVKSSWEPPFPLPGRPWNDLPLRWRVTWPALLFFLVAIGVSALSSGAVALSTVYTSLSK